MFRSILLPFLLLLQCAKADYVDLKLDEFAQGVEDGRYRILADVRTSREYENGHIPQSTLMENLASFGNAAQVSTPADLAGCETCPIVVFDTNGARARVALQFLAEAGFSNLYLFEGGMDAWKAEQFDLEKGTDSVTPSCTGPETITCSGLTLSVPTTPPVTSSPTYGRIDESRRLSAEQLAQMKSNGEVGVIMDIREDFSGGHIAGATLVGLLSFDNVAEKVGSFSPCFRCSVVVYGESAANAIVVLRSYGFSSHLYEGPSVQDWQDTGNTLSTEESDPPACLSDTGAQFACEQQWLKFQNMPFVAPTNPPVLESVPSTAPVSEPTGNDSSPSGENPTAIDSVVTSGADRWNVVLLGSLSLSTLLCAFIL